jgi:Molecular chaperone GrpE (heat shock protein)
MTMITNSSSVPGHTGGGKMSENEKLNEMVENKLEKVEENLIEKLTKEKEELTEHLRRLKAEFENFKKDALRDREMILKNANEYLLTKLIPVLDDLERAFSTVEHGATYEDFYKGMRLIYKKLWKLLNDEGLFKIEVGQKFGGSSRVDLQACKLGTGRRFTTS